MPDLDVTEVLSDPDFADTFTIISTSRSMATGVPVDTAAAPVSASGVIIPGKSNLRRADDGSRLDAYIDIYTQATLTNGFKTDDSNSQLADVVAWRNRSYTVMVIEDWSNYGQGFIKASCDLLALNPPAASS